MESDIESLDGDSSTTDFDFTYQRGITSNIVVGFGTGVQTNADVNGGAKDINLFVAGYEGQFNYGLNVAVSANAEDEDNAKSGGNNYTLTLGWEINDVSGVALNYNLGYDVTSVDSAGDETETEQAASYNLEYFYEWKSNDCLFGAAVAIQQDGESDADAKDSVTSKILRGYYVHSFGDSITTTGLDLGVRYNF